MESAVSLVRFAGAGHLRGLLLGTGVECDLVQGMGVHVTGVCGVTSRWASWSAAVSLVKASREHRPWGP